MRSLITSILLFALLLLISRFIFEPTYLYYEIWWLDIPMHIIGGFLVGTIFINLGQVYHWHVRYAVAVIGFLCGALLWEYYEYARGVADITLPGWSTDTVKDLFDGVLGFSIPFIIRQYGK